MNRAATVRVIAVLLLRDLIRLRSAAEIAAALELLIDEVIDEAPDHPDGPLAGDLRSLGVLPPDDFETPDR
jgi:hypothetical protein